MSLLGWFFTGESISSELNCSDKLSSRYNNYIICWLASDLTLSGDFSVFFIFDFEVFEAFEFSLFRVFSGLFVENPNSKSTYNFIVYLELFHQAYLLSIDMSVIFCTKIDLLLSSLFVNHWSECWLIKFISTIKVNILNIIYCFCEPKIILLDFQLNYLDWYFWIIVSIRMRLDLLDLNYDKK